MVRLDDAGIALMRSAGRTAATRRNQSGFFVSPVTERPYLQRCTDEFSGTNDDDPVPHRYGRNGFVPLPLPGRSLRIRSLCGFMRSDRGIATDQDALQ